MLTSRVYQIRHWVFTLIVAALLALSALSASIWSDELIGTSLTPSAFACQPQGGTCG